MKNFQEFKVAEKDLIEILLANKQSELLTNKADFEKLINNDQSPNLQSVGYAALISAEGADKFSRNFSENNTLKTVSYLRGISLIRNRENIQVITNLIEPKGEYVNVATDIISSQTDQELKGLYAENALNRILAYIKGTPENQRESEQFNNVVTLGKRLAALLPQAESDKALSILNNAGTMEIKLSTLPAKMLFDKETLTVTTGRSVSLIFENPDLMPHNVVIVKPGTAEKVGESADAMAKMKDGFEKNFIPDLSDVLFSTPLVNAGKNFQLDFKAPEQPGDYPFICSFPGHWRVMKGILKVVQPEF